MRTQRSADIVSGGFLAILGVTSLITSLKISGVTGEHLHPRTLPLLLSWIVMGTGIILAITGWLYRGEKKVIAWPDRHGSIRILVTCVSLIIYLLLIETLGFPLSTLIFITFLVWYLGRYHIVLTFIIGILSAATVFFLFIHLLELPFPVGPLGW